MVVALGPGKFYGSSLPRPRIYTDVKLNDHRVDPPVPVLDPFMSWAQEAHWSMGGLSFKRLRLQGRIEGSVKKLRVEREKFLKKRKLNETDQMGQKSAKASVRRGVEKTTTPSPPPAPMAIKRRRFMALVDEDEDEDDQELEAGQKQKGNGGDEAVGVKRRPARKLGDDFDRVASESGLGKNRGSPSKRLGGGSETVASRTRSRRSEREGDDTADDVNESRIKGKKLKLKGYSRVNGSGDSGASTPTSGTRTSPRLAKRESS